MGKLGECIKENLGHNKPVILASCLTGGPRGDGELNLAARLSEETGIAGCKGIKYDRHGRKIGQQTKYFSETVPATGYDVLENLLKIERQGTFHLQSGIYTYDSLSQLISEQTEQYKTYSHDSLGNSRLVDSEEFLYNNLNQLTGPEKREYSYDPQGNLFRKVLGKAGTCFTFDILSRLTTVEKDDGAMVSYNYDGFGRRIAKELF